MASRHHDRRDQEASLELTRRHLLQLAGGAMLAGAQASLPRALFAANEGCPTSAVFDPPANWQDFPPGSSREELHCRWSRIVNQYTEQAILGNPWTSNLDAYRDYYFNPLTTEIPTGSPVKLIEWIAFPNRIETYLGHPWHDFTQDQLFEFAENGRLADGMTLPTIPRDVCPFIDSTPIPTMPYGPPGPRGWQDEYCEWAVERDPDGEIVRVMFTCENPEYWYTLWSVQPQRVLELYRQLTERPVRLEDLYLRDAAGKPVRDPTIGEIAYNPLNKWNNSTHLLRDSGGAIHLTSPPNNLGAEIGLGAAATLARKQDANPQELVCCTPFGQSFRHSDPHIGYTINQAVRELNMRITITNPVGLYIQQPDFENIELPAEAIRDGFEAKDFWNLTRGEPGMGLHAVFRAPEGFRGKISDLRINGQPIRWAAQITTTFQIGLRGVFIPPPDSSVQQRLLDCPNDEDPVPDRPAPLQLLDYQVMLAHIANDSPGDSSTAAPAIRRGQTLIRMALVTTGTKVDTPITFPAGGIDVKVCQFIENQCYHVPGNTGGGVFNVFVIDIHAHDDAPLGQLDLRLGTDFNPAGKAFLTVVA